VGEAECLRRRGQVEGDGPGQAKRDDPVAALANLRSAGARHGSHDGRNQADIVFPATGEIDAAAPPSSA
jgi:hypothetical protein